MTKMAEKLVPNAEQAAAIEQIVTDPSGATLCAAELGTGKTLLGVETAIQSEAERVLVICPLGTMVGWERTFKSQGWELPVRRITSKKAGKEAHADMLANKPGAYLVGREYFRRLEWAKYRPDLVVADEIHFAQNRQSVSHKKLMTLKANYKLALSGTPFRNKFEGMWAVTRWLWPTVTDRSFWRWTAVWCYTEYNPWSKVGKTVKGERVPGTYVTSLPSYVFIESNIAEPTTELRFVELTPAQRKMYNSMEEDGLAWLMDNPLVAKLPISQRIRLRQMTLGTVTMDDEGVVDFDVDSRSSKIAALKEIIADSDDEPILILLGDSAKFAKVVAHQIKGDVALWTGATSLEDRERILETFGRDGGPKYLVATVGAIAEGVDGLQRVCHTMVWLSKSEDGVLNEQAMGRLARTGQLNQVMSYEIIAEDTYDEGIYSKLLRQEIENRASLKAELTEVR